MSRETMEKIAAMSLSEIRDAIKFHQQHINLLLLEVDERISVAKKERGE